MTSYNKKAAIIATEIMSRMVPLLMHRCRRLELPSLSEEEFGLFCSNNCGHHDYLESHGMLNDLH